MEPHASPVVSVGMAAIALAVLAAIVAGVHRAYRGSPARARATAIAAALAALWAGGTWAVAAAGLLARFDARPPPFAVLAAALVAVGLALGLSAPGRRLASLPLAALVGFHGFRLPLELVMHQAALEGVMPPQMTWTGWNLDVVTGASAIVVALLVAAGRAPRWLVWAWNLLGLALLTVVVAIALASTPMVQAFGSAPPLVNTWVAYPPYVWLPAILVAAALAGHIVVTRHLRAPR
jgi:hypothetical protein